MQKLKTEQIRKNKFKEIFFSLKYIYIFEITFNVHFNFFLSSS